MPQARSGGSGSSSKGASSRRSTGASKAKSTARASSGSRAKSPARSASSSRSTGTRSTRATKAARSTKSTTTKATAKATTKARRRTASTAGSADAVALRLRKLNERIIEAGREAGETTLTNYEKALKAIASTLERGPGSSDVEWVANLATAQAKFIRDVTTSWTAAARKALK
jgi:hypothetical protein